MSRTANMGLLLTFIIAIWAVELVNTLLGHRLNDYGVLPRTVQGLRGILLLPVLHGGFGHVLANTLPLLILGGLIALRGRGNFLLATLFIALVGGGLLWLVGRSSLHIGASVLVFGYFGYLVARGAYERSCLAMLIALAVIVVFGWGMVQGILPGNGFISWEGHLCGLAAGVAAALAGGRGREGGRE